VAVTKVLHSITGLNIGGAELMLSRFLGKSDREVYAPEVLVLMREGPVAAQIEKLGVHVASLRMGESSIRPSDFWALRRQVVAAKPDLIHGWMYHGNAAASIGAFTSLRFPPVIWSIHHSVANLAAEKPMTRRVVRVLARLSGRVSAISYCSKVAADQHEALGFDGRKRRVIPNGIDCIAFTPSAGARRSLTRLLDIPAKRKIVGNVARFHPMKDQANLVRATAVLLQQGHDVQCLFIGADHDENGPVLRTARELGVASHVTILGARNDVANLLPGFDVYALSSAWGEAFPLAVGEAMACGVPTVATDVGDCGWLVGNTGRIVPPSNQDALAAALADILSLAPGSRLELGRRARARVIENFSLERYVSEHEALYREVLERHSEVPPGMAGR
jgi:glycosyltransferase involved in cell wall biosynthesis